MRGGVEFLGFRLDGCHLRLDCGNLLVGDKRRGRCDERGRGEAKCDEGGAGEWICIHGYGRWGGDPGIGRSAEKAYAFLECVDKPGSLGGEAVGGDLDGFLGGEAGIHLVEKCVFESDFSAQGAVRFVETDEDVLALDVLRIDEGHGLRLEVADEVALLVVAGEEDAF